MLMVVFGAGASYDSVPSRRQHAKWPILSRPPLANELFADRPLFVEMLERFPACQPIVPYLQNLQPTQSVEGLLEELQAATATYPRGTIQLAAVRYYLQSMLGRCESDWEREAARGITNYKTLLDQIERFRRPDEPVLLVTFNYDSMLERALGPFGVTIRSLADYVSNDVYKIIKLHGSVNWGRLVTVPAVDKTILLGKDDWSLANDLIDHAATLQVSDRYYFQYQIPMTKAEGNTIIPALAIPLQKKQSYECPAEHLEVLKTVLPRVRRLLIIGWRATDRPFLELLRGDGRHAYDCLVVVGGTEPAREVMANIREAGIPTSQRPPGAGGFTDFILQHEGDALFRS